MSETTASPRWQLAGVLLNRDARWMTPHLWRAGFLVALFLALWFGSEGITRRTAPGLHVLQSLTTVSAFGLMALAVAGVGSLFRDEWVGNNWDLLELTGIGGFDLLLAKLIPTWLTAASLLMLEIPCFLLCITLGGVSLLQIVAVCWQLTWLFLEASGFTLLTLAFSKKRRNHTEIALEALTVFVIWAGFVGLIDAAVAFLLSGANFGWLNYFSDFRRIFRTGFTGPVITWATLVHAATFAGCLFLSSRKLRARMHEPHEELTVEEIVPQGEAHRTPIPVWRPSYQLPPITGNAIEWKDYHFTIGGDEMMWGKWIFLLIAVALVGFVALAGFVDSGIWSAFLPLVTFLSVLGVVAMFVFTARRLWQQEIRERTIGDLVMLPLTSYDIIRAKLRVFVKSSLPEIVLMAILLGIIFLYSIRTREWMTCGMFVGLLLSVPLVVCTDAAWRFLPQSWDGLGPRILLVGMNLGVWIISGSVAAMLSPALGLLLLAILVPIACRSSIDTAAYWLGNYAGELE
jgi:hypothetical protein